MRNPDREPWEPPPPEPFAFDEWRHIAGIIAAVVIVIGIAFGLTFVL